ncbi:MAG: hypothetical protein AAF281_10880 [Pseudomonadota bacterium]
MDKARLSYLQVALGAALLVWLGFLAARSDENFWFDEVFTLGAAGVNGTLDWDVLLRDVHPPTHVALVHLASQFVDGARPVLRAINALALIPLVLAFLLLRAQIGRERATLAALVLVANTFFFLFSLELRVYGLLLGTAALGHVLLFCRLRAVRGAEPGLIATALALTGLHFFGAALGTALLLVSAADHVKAGRRRRALVPLGFAGLCVALTLGWAFVLGDVRGALGGALWIRNEFGPWIDFALNQPLVLAGVVLLLAARRQGATSPALVPVLWLLAPFGLVIAVALAISLHSPVVSTKNLTVGVPAMALVMGLAMPAPLLAALDRTVWSVVGVVAVCLGAAYSGGGTPQYIRWAVETATPAPCHGRPLYVVNPDSVDRYAQRVFLGAVLRPPTDILSLPPKIDAADWTGACRVIAAGYHEFGRASTVTAFFRDRGLDVTVRQAPDPRAAAGDQRSFGYVVEVRGPTP